MRISGWIGGGLAAGLVGASFPVSEALVDYPYEAGQAIRYLFGALILTVLLKGKLGRPTLKEFALLFGVAAVGMVIFNLAVLGTVDRIGATNAGVVIGASPVVLALVVPLIARRTPNRRFVTAALVVVAGAALVNGTDDRLSAIGLTLALTALAGEVGFTLLAAPLLPRLGAMRVAAWASWIATAQLLVLTKGDLPTPTTDPRGGDRLPRRDHDRARVRPLVQRRPAARRRQGRPADRPDAGRRRRRRRRPQRPNAVPGGCRGDGARGRGCRPGR